MLVPNPLQALKVLLVEADPISRQSLALILKNKGAGVIAVRSAKEALATLGQFKPNVYIINLRLPEEDGYSLIRKIRALPPEQGGHIPAIALTTSVFGEQEQSCLADFQVQMMQPFGIAQLVGSIRSLICES